MERRGMTLVEMLVALVIFVIVLAGALGALRSQTTGFDRGTDDLNVLQNMRFAADLLTQQIRTAGAGLALDQPLLVYADTVSLAYNANYVSNDPTDLEAVYIDPDAPPAETIGLASQITVPRSTFNYPVTGAVYPDNQAETIIFFFEPDTNTADPEDFVLRRQVNDSAPEVVIRNVLPYPGRTFFRYLIETVVAGEERLDTVPTSWYPLTHPDAQYTGNEAGIAGRINRVRAVEVNYTVTNARSGEDLRTEEMSFTVSLPNAGIVQQGGCGAVPILGTVGLVAAPGGVVNAPTIDLTWSAAADESGGERDIVRYIIWRRPDGVGPWGQPYRSIPAGRSSYIFTDSDVEPDETWEYQLAAQDCTPSTSTATEFSLTTVPSP